MGSASHILHVGETSTSGSNVVHQATALHTHIRTVSSDLHKALQWLVFAFWTRLTMDLYIVC